MGVAWIEAGLKVANFAPHPNVNCEKITSRRADKHPNMISYWYCAVYLLNMSVYKPFLGFPIRGQTRLNALPYQPTPKGHSQPRKPTPLPQPRPEKVKQEHTHNTKNTKTRKQSHSTRDLNPLEH